MANELGVYDLFRNILAASTVIEGRFFVLHGVSAEMNSTNMGQLLTDALDSYKEEKKYPCVVLSPPYETEPNDDRGWSVLRFDMYFLTLHHRTGDGDLKTPDTESNISLHTKEMDWKDMRQVAGNFKKKLRELTRVPPLANQFREHAGSGNTYYRLTYKMNDNVNGIKLVFDMQMANDYCSLDDYASDAVIEIPELSPHKLHKH
jgi:hypothetical protein